MCVVMVQRDRKVNEWEQIFRNNNVKVVKVEVGRLGCLFLEQVCWLSSVADTGTSGGAV